MISLAIEASTYIGSVAIFEGERVVAEREVAMRGRDRELLMPAVDEVLRLGGIPRSRVDRVICGAGPGSFTSLRIAASIAKGLAVGLGRPLFSVSSLALIVAANAPAGGAPRARFVAVQDALRNELYMAEFEVERTVRQAAPARIVAASELASILAEGVRAVGPGRDDAWLPKAAGALRVDSLAGPVNLAAWEPAYGRLAEAQVKWEATHRRALQG